jgi:hypothetical protein
MPAPPQPAPLAASGAMSSSEPARTPLMRVVRRVRNFSPRAFLHSSPTAVYLGIFGCIVTVANVAQYRRMKSIYPDYDKYAKMQGARYNEAKTQELFDVNRYNNMVSSMRQDISSRRKD